MLTLVTILAALGLLVLTLELLRRRQLREKYAALWIAVSLLIVILAIFPGVLTWLSDSLGFGIPANLLFTLAFGLLLVVAMQLSLEIGRLEDESQRLAEEVALLWLQIEGLRRDTGAEETGADHDEPGPPSDVDG